MFCTSPTWITYALNGMLCLAGLLVIVLMQKAEHDKSINRVDSKWLRNARRASFMAIAWSVVIALLSDMNQIAILLLFTSTTAVLLVDIVALQHRPPATGHKAASEVGATDHQHAALFRRRAR